MNKRIKKKRELEERLMVAEMHIGFLLDQNNQLWSVVEQNARSTNKEFKKLGQELRKFNKQSKKSIFKRR